MEYIIIIFLILCVGSIFVLTFLILYDIEEKHQDELKKQKEKYKNRNFRI